jgi:hypothetical protein
MNQPAQVPGGVRLPWEQVPAEVRAAVEQHLGAPVARAVTRHGGFSPGAAARLELTDGRRVFAKAVSATLNPGAPALYRREARLTAALPACTPSPRMRFTYDDGAWVALVFDYIDGRHPHLPWRKAELHATLDALQVMAERLTPAPVDFVPAAGQLLAEEFATWRRLAHTDRVAGMDAVLLDHLDELVVLEASWEEWAAGETLAHCDLRVDNLLVASDGQVWVVDWAWPCRAAAWFDALLLLSSVPVHGGPDVEEVLGAHALTRAIDPDAVNAVLAAFLDYCADAARQPAPPGLPTVRAAQAAQAGAAWEWLARRRGWR